MKRPVLIFRRTLLPPSNTFILDQGESLLDFEAHYLGIKGCRGLKLPEGRAQVISGGRYLWKLLRGDRLKPRLIHAHFGPDAALALPMAERLGIPLVVTFHGYDATANFGMRFGNPAGLIYKALLRILAKRAQKVIAVSDFIRNKLIYSGFPESKVVRHYCGINLQEFKPERGSRREKSVLFAARLVEKKGTEFLINAARILNRRHPDLRVLILGDGPLMQKLKTQSRDIPNIEFLGWQPRSEVRRLMSAARLFCAPGVIAGDSDADGLSTAVLEAQAMGLPVVGFASGSAPEAVMHGSTGLLAEEKNTEELAHYLDHLLTEASTWQKMSANGPDWISSKFNLAAQAEKLGEIYEEAIHG